MGSRRSWTALFLAFVLASVTSGTTMGEVRSGGPAAVADAVFPGLGRGGGPELARVKINNEGGSPVDGVVVATLWPSLEARLAMKDGDHFTPTPIDKAPLDRGIASIQAGDPAAMASHTSKDGLLMVLLEVLTDGGRTSLLLERSLAPSGRWIASSDVTAEQDESVAADAVAFTLRAEFLSPLPGTDGIEEPVARHHQNSLYWCSDVTTGGNDYDGSVMTTETIATTAVTNGVTAKVFYDSGAKTTSGAGHNVGLSAYGFGATWSQDSTVTRTSTLSASYATISGASGSWTNKEWRVTREYKKYYRHCPMNFPSDDWYTERWIEPALVGGFPATINSRYAVPQCDNIWPLTGVNDITTDSTTAATYGSAFKVGWGTSGGNNLYFWGTAQSGYTTTVKIKFTRPSAGYWYWCGDEFNPAESRRVRAGR